MYLMLLLNAYKVFIVKPEPRHHFGVQCNGNGGGLESLGLVLDLMSAWFGCKRVWSVWISGSNYMLGNGDQICCVGLNLTMESCPVLWIQISEWCIIVYMISMILKYHISQQTFEYVIICLVISFHLDYFIKKSIAKEK